MAEKGRFFSAGYWAMVTACLIVLLSCGGASTEAGDCYEDGTCVAGPAPNWGQGQKTCDRADEFYDCCVENDAWIDGWSSYPEYNEKPETDSVDYPCGPACSDEEYEKLSDFCVDCLNDVIECIADECPGVIEAMQNETEENSDFVTSIVVECIETYCSNEWHSCYSVSVRNEVGS